MKHSTPIFKILAACVLAGVLLLFGLQLWQYFSDPMTTTLVYKAETEVTVSVDGWVVREEETFHTDGGTLIHALGEGAKVGVGQLLVSAYSSHGALDTVKKIEEKNMQLQQLEFALSSYMDPDAALKLDGDITEGLLALRGNLSRNDYTAAAEEIAHLKGNILKRSYSYSSAPEIQQEIRTVQQELSELRGSLSDVTNIRAKRPGTYSAVCDGYEGTLNPSFLDGLTPAGLEGITAGGQDGAAGKLIYGDTWYYAFTLSQSDTARVLDSQQVLLRFPKGLEQDVAVEIVSISEVQDGKQAVVVSCDKYMAQVTQLRRQTATLVLDSHSGLRIPANALRLDEAGQSGVYCLVGFAADFKPVDVVYRGDGYTLVRAAESAAGGDILRSGDEVIVTASQLYDGKVVQ